MKILAYEQVTGGGMLGDKRMSALAPEGDAMLRALLDDLTAVAGVEVSAMRDARLGADLPATLLPVGSASGFWPAFRNAMRNVDAVWPIAPEQDGILLRLTDEIVQSGRILLGCRPDAVKIAASKRATADILGRAGVASVACYADEGDVPADIGEIVVKPDDGAGCQDTLLFRDRLQLRKWAGENARGGLVYQPFINGDARSLSLLCCDGRARVLACNRQKVRVAGGVFEFSGVSVGAITDVDGYAQLAGKIAQALPGLWGYCGVDFIETNAGPIVIEVNPRLTTSYAGLRQATGMNPAKLVLDLPGSIVAAGKRQRTRAIEVEVAHAG